VTAVREREGREGKCRGDAVEEEALAGYKREWRRYKETKVELQDFAGDGSEGRG
jgi:hypothetical protein